MRSLYDGHTYVFDPSDSFAVLDWGRGVWTYKTHGTGALPPARWTAFPSAGTSATASATPRPPAKTCCFTTARRTSSVRVKFNIPGDEKAFMEPWTFTSDDGRFEMGFRPVLDRASCTDVGLIKSDQHQVFGLFTGKAVLDDGKVIEIKTSPALPRRSRINGNTAQPGLRCSPGFARRQTPAGENSASVISSPNRISFLSSNSFGLQLLPYGYSCVGRQRHSGKSC